MNAILNVGGKGDKIGQTDDSQQQNKRNPGTPHAAYFEEFTTYQPEKARLGMLQCDTFCHGRSCNTAHCISTAFVNCKKACSRSCMAGARLSGAKPALTRKRLRSRPRPLGAGVMSVPSLSRRAFCPHGHLCIIFSASCPFSTFTAYSPFELIKSSIVVSVISWPWLIMATLLQICCTSLRIWL